MSASADRGVAQRGRFTAYVMLGYLSLLPGAILLGTMTPAARYAMDGGVSFLDLSAARAWIGSVLVVASLALTARRPSGTRETAAPQRKEAANESDLSRRPAGHRVRPGVV